MHWPQITMIVFAGISLGVSASQHGKPKDDVHSIWWTLIALGLEFWILSEGGFFG